VTAQMVTSNGTVVTVKVHITPQAAMNGSLEDLTYGVRVERAPSGAWEDDRRLTVLVNSDGVVVDVSRGTPQTVFGMEVTTLIGSSLDGLVDAFKDWAATGEDRNAARTKAAVRGHWLCLCVLRWCLLVSVCG